MEQLRQQKDTLKLAKQIIHELELDHSCNTLSRWMVHYLSEKLLEAEKEEDPLRKNMLEKECSELIFKIWDLKGSEFSNLDPLKDLSSALETLEQLRNNKRDILGIYRNQNSKDPYAKVSDAINGKSFKVLSAILLLSLLPVNIYKAKEKAINLGDLLSEDEIRIIERLEMFVDDFGSTFIHDESLVKPEYDKEYVKNLIEKIESIINEQLVDLEEFKNKILK